jgi:hypothetical protein
VELLKRQTCSQADELEKTEYKHSVVEVKASDTSLAQVAVKGSCQSAQVDVYIRECGLQVGKW